MSDVDDDLSASTQRFQAFAQRQEQETSAAWEMRAPASKVWILVAIVIVIAVIAAILALVIVG